MNSKAWHDASAKPLSEVVLFLFHDSQIIEYHLSNYFIFSRMSSIFCCSLITLLSSAV